MALVQSSPWTDAAQYGQGLGQALGQVLLQLPAVRAQVAQQLAQAHMEQQRFSLQQAQFGLQGQQFQLQQQQEKTRAAEEQRRLGFEQQRVGFEQTLREAQAQQLQERARDYASQTAQRQRLEDVGNQLALQSAQPVPPGQQGPPAPTMEGLQYQALASDPSALARVLGDQIIAQRQAQRVPADKRFLVVPQGGQVFDTQGPGGYQTPSEAAPKTFPPGVQSSVFDQAVKTLSDPISARMIPPGLSNVLYQITQSYNPQLGLTNAPQAQPQGTNAAPITATGPNGQKLILINGQWQPMQQ